MSQLFTVADLQLPGNICEKINHSRKVYALGGISFTIVSLEPPTVVVKQERLLNGYILNNQQLYERAKQVFQPANLPVLRIIPAVYRLNAATVTTEWMLAQTKEFQLNAKDLSKQLAISLPRIRQVLSGKEQLRLSEKAAFYYYFLGYGVNRDLREELTA